MADHKDKEENDTPKNDKEVLEKLRKGLEDILEKSIRGYDRWDRDKRPEDFGERDDEKPNSPTP